MQSLLWAQIVGFDLGLKICALSFRSTVLILAALPGSYHDFLPGLLVLELDGGVVLV